MPTVNINGRNVDAEEYMADWALALMSQGIIVKLSISRWSAKMKLKPETLGLRFINEDGSDFMKDYVRLGQQNLLPPQVLKELETLEARARILLATYSFNTVWGKFVPFTAFEEWEKANNAIRMDFIEQAKSIGERYDSLVGAVKKDYCKLARDVWARLYPEDKGGATVSFVEDFVTKIINKIPPREDIVASFKYNALYFVIPMPSFVSENIARAERILQDAAVEADMKKFENEMEKETKRKVADEYIARKKELIDGFLESTVKMMRKYISDLCDSVLQAIAQKSRSGRVTSGQLNKLKAMIKKVKLLNFYDDDDISKLISDLDKEIDKFKGERNDVAVVDKLKEIVDVSKKEFMPKNFNPAISVLEV